MKFGLAFANTMNFTTAAGATALAQGAEAAGFDSVWTVEHVLWPEGYESTYPYAESGKMPGSADTPIPDPLIWLSYIAAVTTELKLATGVMILPQRNPAILAKEVATLDSMSGGRVVLGIGVGWLEEEFDALGVPFAGRGRRADEWIAVMRALWAGDSVSHEGEFMNFDRVSVNPKPASGTVPVHIGGHSRKAAERAGRSGEGFFPGAGKTGELFDIARQTAADAGRDPNAIEMTTWHEGLFGSDPAAAVEELQSWGVSRTVVPAFLFAGQPDPAPAMADFLAKMPAIS